MIGLIRWKGAALHAAVLFIVGTALSLVHCVSDHGDSAVVLEGGATVLEGGVLYEEGGNPIYDIGGTISGLSSLQTVTLTLNGGITATNGNGNYTFPQKLADGQAYVVAVKTKPDTAACAVVNATGAVHAASVVNANVQCVSRDATLSALSVSAAPITPGFDPAVLTYATSLHLPGIFPPFKTTTVTATTAVTGATLTIGGMPATSGQPSAPITLKGGQNTIDVGVTAPDNTATAHYTVNVTGVPNDYLKASNTRQEASFGYALAISADGNTLAIGSSGESSNATGINGNQNDSSSSSSGAVYVFVRASGVWTQQAYVKASNSQLDGGFGEALAFTKDGNTLVVGSPGESGGSTGVNGNQADRSKSTSGAVYAFTRTGTTWTQQVYIKPSNTVEGEAFGNSIAFSADGTTLAVGASGESSDATTINGDQSNQNAGSAGAVFVFTHAGTTWAQQAYVKASNGRANGLFGHGVTLSSDGNTLVVGANGESSNAIGIGGNQSDTSIPFAGAAYVFSRSGATWSQDAYLKGSHADKIGFGAGVSISADGNRLAVGAPNERSKATGINDLADQNDTSESSAGALFVFSRSANVWTQEAYVKPAFTQTVALFGWSVSMSADGNALAIGGYGEASPSSGVNGDPSPTTADSAGAVWVFSRGTTTWSQTAYVKASNSRAQAWFGLCAAISGDGKTVAVGAPGETSSVTGVNGNQNDTAAVSAGAAYVF